MPAVLAILKDRKELLTNEIFLLSAVTALQHVMETLLHFISPYLRDATSQVHLMFGEVISRSFEDKRFLNNFAANVSMLTCCY